MKLENLEAYTKEDGTIDFEALNKDIQVETAKSFQEGQKRAKKETASEYESKLEAEKTSKMTEIEKTQQEKESEINKVKAQLEELQSNFKEKETNDVINKFKKEAKGKLSDKQVEDLINITKVEALAEFNFDLYSLKEVEDAGTSVEPTENELNADEKKSLLEQIRSSR